MSALLLESFATLCSKGRWCRTSPLLTVAQMSDGVDLAGWCDSRSCNSSTEIADKVMPLRMGSTFRCVSFQGARVEGTRLPLLTPIFFSGNTIIDSSLAISFQPHGFLVLHLPLFASEATRQAPVQLNNPTGGPMP